MAKSIQALGTLITLAAATPAVAQYEPVFTETESIDYGDFLRYRPFHLQIEGGPTITQGNIEQNLDNGWNAGAGLTWTPTSHLPLSLRVDGVYNHFDARTPALRAATAQLQTPVNNGTVRIWGGDTDAEIDFTFRHHFRLYLVGGVGWYDEQDTFRQAQTVSGRVCGFFSCGPGTQTVYSLVARNTTGVHFAKNAGFGIELGLSENCSLFADARYLRIDPSSRRNDYIPVRFGLRF